MIMFVATSSGMNPAPRLFGIGTVVLDHVLQLPAWPAANSKVQIAADWRQVGGPVPTALVMAARLGASCGFAGRWGDDPAGADIVANLRAEGLDLSASQPAPGGRSGFAQVWVDARSGDRTIAFSRGDFAPLSPLELPGQLDLLHLDGAHGDSAVAAARAFKGPVVVDAGSMKPRMDELLPLADVVVCSGQFMQAVTGSNDPAIAGPALRGMGLTCVVMTAGEGGAWILDADGMRHQPAFQAEAVDTNGAGDVFCGGLIWGLAGGATLDAAVRVGAAAAAIKCAAVGNREALPDRERVELLLGSGTF